LRIVENVGFYYPESSGGTEVYVSSLVKGLRAHGVECAVAAPSQSARASRYIHEGTEVFRYPVPAVWLRREIQGGVPPRQFNIFEDWLREQRADVYHQHSWTTGCGLWHLKAAKRIGLKTVVTAHVPGNICVRGTMLYEGRTACDGEIRPERCASCWLQSKGLSASAARRLAALPQGLAGLVRLPRLGPVLTAKALATNHKKQLQEMTAASDRIVAVCGWLHDAMIANGVPPAKLVLNRQGVGQWTPIIPLPRSNKSTDVLRLGFLGRCDPLKGVHVLVDAVKRLPADVAIELDICAIGTDSEAEKYRDVILRSAAGDRRIRFRPALEHAEVGDFLARIDALAVPSQWLETGPLVLLEAFAAGTPVIGSDLGGIKELVSHERDGLLVPHDDVNAWTATLVRLATDRTLLQRLRRGIGPVRTMADVARDMAAVYRELSTIGANAA
jgi:glycosyltransferase involved in cell wall biosynthesis